MTWVVIEEQSDGPSTVGLEVLTKAATLGPTTVVYVGSGSNDAFQTLGDHGANAVFHLSPAAEELATTPVAGALSALISEHNPSLVLFGITYDGRDVAGRVSAKLGLPVVSNAIGFSIEGGITITNEIFGGTKLVDTQFTSGSTALALIRPKSFNAEPVGGGLPVVTPVALFPVPSARVTARHAEAAEGPQLESASVVVAGGRGLGQAEHFGLIEDLAGLLGGATGATRAIVDAGWVPYAKQVGQTGKTVKPEVYIAFGISGAMQHVVGMKDATTIIAVNKDAEAPIFSIADLGVVGDVHNVLPKLIEAIRSR